MSYKTLCASTITLPYYVHVIFFHSGSPAGGTLSAESETADLIDWGLYGNVPNLNKRSPN